MTEITVTATRWSLGWELTVPDAGATQTRTLARAEQQVRDYLDTVSPDVDHRDWTITVVPDLGGVQDEVRQAKKASAAAAAAQVEAGRRMRELAGRLRAQGLSMADTACVLGVSKGRVSQLV